MEGAAIRFMPRNLAGEAEGKSAPAAIKMIAFDLAGGPVQLVQIRGRNRQCSTSLGCGFDHDSGRVPGTASSHEGSG